MKKHFLVFLIMLFVTAQIYPQISVSGILDSTVSARAGAGDSPAFSCGIEEFANIRFLSRFDWGRVDGAVNLFAAAGDFAAAAAAVNPAGIAVGENYIAGIELERLYFRLSGENVDFDFGLMRIPFGYGQVWAPSDFLNPRNPLKPDARLRGVLGSLIAWFPVDGVNFKVQGFGAAPPDPLFKNGEGGLAGFALDQHWERISLQWLYAFELPKNRSMYGIHRTGLSVKADVEVGLLMDALYSYNHEGRTKWDGLSFSAGIDYSFFKSKLIILAEYLYSGATSSTAIGYGGAFSNRHYLSTAFTWVFNDITNLSLALISGFNDVSFTPLITFNRELFQGGTLTLTAQVPLDRDLFSGNGSRGELGPIPPLLDSTGERFGRYIDFSVRLRLRF